MWPSVHRIRTKMDRRVLMHRVASFRAQNLHTGVPRLTRSRHHQAKKQKLLTKSSRVRQHIILVARRSRENLQVVEEAIEAIAGSICEKDLSQSQLSKCMRDFVIRLKRLKRNFSLTVTRRVSTHNTNSTIEEFQHHSSTNFTRIANPVRAKQ